MNDFEITVCRKLKVSALIILFSSFGCLFPQGETKPSDRFKEGLKIYLSNDSTRFIKLNGLAQIWVRYNDNNPGSAIYGNVVKKSFDVGIRRMRYQVLSKINSRVTFYSQIGINSVNSLSSRKTQLFFHDVTAEYEAIKNHLTIGIGLNGWNGVARYTSSGVGNILCLDLPVIQESTNDITDQFVRKNGIYAKGRVSNLDFRLSVSNPYPVQQVTGIASLPTSEYNTSYFSPRAPNLQYQGYLFWQFLEKENNQLPYMTGSYLGKKRVLNLGSGFSFQKDAMWHRDLSGDTISTSQQLGGIDLFFDYYLNRTKENAITFYLSYLNYNFGPNYIRLAGIMNTANSSVNTVTLSGYGNSIPYYGTGQLIYGQFAYLFRNNLLGSQGTLQPYLSFDYADYKKIKTPFLIYDVGVNWIQNGQNSKISFDYQSRPIFISDPNGNEIELKSARRGCLVLQYQVMF